jgi:alpha-glucosidase
LFKGRDGCRTPMPWDGDAPHMGFTVGTPWLPLGPGHAALAVSRQARDPDSTLAYARRLMAARKEHPALRLGTQELLPEPGLAFIRRAGAEAIVCAFNPDAAEIVLDLPDAGRDLGLGTGAVHAEGGRLRLGPRSAWFGLL